MKHQESIYIGIQLVPKVYFTMLAKGPKFLERTAIFEKMVLWTMKILVRRYEIIRTKIFIHGRMCKDVAIASDVIILQQVHFYDKHIYLFIY